MWGEGKSASQIAKELGGVTRNAVIGKVHRLGLSNRNGGGGSSAAKTEAKEKPAAAAKPYRLQSTRAQARTHSGGAICASPIPQADRSRRQTPPQPSTNEISPEAPAKVNRSKKSSEAVSDGTDRTHV